jgi:L-asparaginase/Glu-tRNA(Gln) amidotransferase subunit D
MAANALSQGAQRFDPLAPILVTRNERIVAARSVTKSSTSFTDAFKTPSSQRVTACRMRAT